MKCHDENDQCDFASVEARGVLKANRIFVFLEPNLGNAYKDPSDQTTKECPLKWDSRNASSVLATTAL